MGRTYSARGPVVSGRITSVGGELPLLVMMKPVGENIADSIAVVSLNWGELTLLSFFTLRGVNVPQSYSSAKSIHVSGG